MKEGWGVIELKVLFIIPEFEYLGIEFLSSILIKNGHKSKLIFDPTLFSDMFMNKPWLAQKFDAGDTILREVKNYNPDVVMFSLVSDSVSWFKKRAAKIKEITNVPIIVGGIHATSVPMRVARLPFVDFVVTGEGDYILPELLERISNGKDIAGINGVFYKYKGEIMGSMNTSLIQDLSDMPIPDKELFYDAAPWATGEYNFIASRGCPNDCSFCHNNITRDMWDKKGRFVRHRPVENAISELLKYKKKYDFTTLRMWDDNLLTMKEFSRDLLEEYAEKIHVPFRISVHPSTITKDTARLLSKAGCWEVEMGIQTTDVSGRKICGRWEDNDTIVNAVRYLKDEGIRTLADCISYIPGDKPKKIYTMAKDISNIKPYRAITYTLRYYPKTGIIKYALENGELTEKDIEDIEEGDYKGTCHLTSYDAKRDKVLHRLAGILMLSPYLPQRFISFLEAVHAERWMVDISEFIQFMNQIKSLFDKNHDMARLFYKKYSFYLLKEGRSWLKLKYGGLSHNGC